MVMDKQLEKLHEKLITRDNIKISMIYSLRNWLAYSFQPPGDNRYLERAYHGAMGAHRRNEPHVRLFSLAMFMAIEAGHLSTAHTMLDAAFNYRKFLIANEPFYYGAFLFLRAYLAIKEHKIRAAKKYSKAFLAYLKTVSYSPYYDVMQGQLQIALGEIHEAYNVLTRAFNHGCRSVFIYVSLYRSLQSSTDLQPGDEILRVLLYAASKGADITKAAYSYEDELIIAAEKDPFHGMMLYNLCNYAPLLKPICESKMQVRDYSISALKLYQTAYENQIKIQNIEAYIVLSSFSNNIDGVNTYALEHFLGSKYINQSLAEYIYYLILTYPSHSRLINRCKDDIITTATRALEDNISGSRVNALYQFLWEYNQNPQAEAKLQSDLTRFELNLPSGTKYVYVSQPEKRGMDEYAIAEDNNRLVIDATDNFSCICLGAGRRQIIHDPVDIKRLVPLANADLYTHFFSKGDRRFQVLAYLAADTESIPVYEYLLEEKSLEKAYRSMILQSLGRLYNKAGQYQRAIDCYAELDIASLEGTYIHEILEVYLKAGRYDLAIDLLARYHKAIPKTGAYNGLTQLLDQGLPNMASLGAAAYDLLLSGHYSEKILTFVLAQHKASQHEWKVLSNSLDSPELRVDAKILLGDLWMNHSDTHTESAFRRLYTAKQSLDECAQFVELLKYLVLAKDIAPEYETINILEKIYLNNMEDDTHLLLALCKVYLSHNITTFRSDRIIPKAIAIQEAQSILLPWFKDTKPYPHPYLEKYQPFMYKSAPGKDIRLNYRIGSHSDYQSIPMDYLSYGIYTAKIPLFYNETINYYYSEEMPTGSIGTKEASHKNTIPYESPPNPDSYFAINNAIIYEQMFRHQQVEDIVRELVKEHVKIKAKLL